MQRRRGTMPRMYMTTLPQTRELPSVQRCVRSLNYLAAGASGVHKGVQHMACAPMERDPSCVVLLTGDLQMQREALALGCAWTWMACGLVSACSKIAGMHCGSVA
jgi:hypothetical protein